MIKNYFDISDFVNVLTPQKAVADLALRVRKRRKEAGLTQSGLAKKAAISYSAIRRFEGTGEISFLSLVAICDALGALGDINQLLSTPIIRSVKDYIEENKHVQ